jgi:multimeric flavodoxin WrbA
MKKVLLINSSYRKKTTYALLKRMGIILTDRGYEIEWLHLAEYQLQPCRGCEICIKRGTCVSDDPFMEIEEKLKSADAIVLSSPVYLRQISGILKTTIDRTCSHYHRPILVGKPILSCVTTMESGAKASLKYLKDITIQWGAIPAGSIGVKMAGIEDADLKEAMRPFLTMLDSPKELDQPSWKRVIDFQVQKALALHVLRQDRAYWASYGWDQRDYYYENQLSWLKKRVGHLFYRVLSGQLDKQKKQKKHVLETREY